MRAIGVYEVCGPLAFRSHKPGSVFMAQLAPTVEQRRIANGHIRLLERVEAALPERWQLPRGWP